MEGRARVREFLQGRPADRPPFLPLALDFSAAVAQASRAELLADPQLLTSALLDVLELSSLDGAIVALDAEEVGAVAGGMPPSDVPVLEVCADAFGRLRALLGERAGVGVLLPGPATLAGRPGGELEPPELEEAGARLLEAAQFLGPPRLDVIGVWEARAIAGEDVKALRSALAPLWNAVRFYAVPSLFAATAAEPPAGSIGAAAVTAWSGATPDALAAAGAGRVGVPVRVSESPQVPLLPPGGFFVTPGEIPPDTEIDWVQALSAELGLARKGMSA